MRRMAAKAMITMPPTIHSAWLQRGVSAPRKPKGAGAALQIDGVTTAGILSVSVPLRIVAIERCRAAYTNHTRKAGIQYRGILRLLGWTPVVLWLNWQGLRRLAVEVSATARA